VAEEEMMGLFLASWSLRPLKLLGATPPCGRFWPREHHNKFLFLLLVAWRRGGGGGACSLNYFSPREVEDLFSTCSWPHPKCQAQDPGAHLCTSWAIRSRFQKISWQMHRSGSNTSVTTPTGPDT